MKGQRQAGGSRESRRRWRIPPPLLRGVEDPGPEGLQVLEELPTPLGFVLWKTLRSVLIWAQAQLDVRGDLFDAGAANRRRAEILTAASEGSEEFGAALEELTRLLEDPGGVDPERVGLACSRIAGWAGGRKLPLTSLEFLQAAAQACPADPSYALSIVRATRDLAQYSRAEAWFFRAVGLARQCRDWDTYVRAYLAHGKMMIRRGSLPAARRSVMKALRRSTRQGLVETRAMALHELFVVEHNLGRLEAAEDFALQALEAYGANHPQAPLLVHDLAWAWVEEGRFQEAYEVLKEVVPSVPEHLRPMAVGSLARTAGAMGSVDSFREAWQALARAGDGPGVAEAWVDAARGALMLGRPEQARDAVFRGEELARSRREGKVRFLAESVLASIEAEERARQSRAAPATPSASPASTRVLTLLRERVEGAPVG